MASKSKQVNWGGMDLLVNRVIQGVSSAAAGEGITADGPVTIADGATYTVLAYNSGRVHWIADQAQDITITLPAAADGLSFEFWYGGTAADNFDWIINTAATSSLYKGGVVHLDADAGSAGDEVVPVYADATDDDTIQVNLPNAGTCVKVVSDGTHWFLNGTVVSATAPTIS